MITIPDNILDDIKERLGAENVLQNEPMKAHSNMEVGGPAAYLFMPKSAEEIGFLIDILKAEGIEYYIIGKGSNVIFKDEGYNGAVIKVLNGFKGMEIAGDEVKVRSGELNKDISERLCREGLSGFEFASGIPGCIGGSIVMNAGAYDGEMKDIVKDVTVLTKDGKVVTLSNEEMHFGYRTSVVPEKEYVVLETTLKLKKEDPSVIQKKVDELTEKRESKQPLEYPSCGSVFKRPEGHFAGGLIADAGLKGKSIGGAQVSEKHAGFIVNKGDATAKDVTDLIAYIQEKVYENSGVKLVCEVKII